MGPEVLKTLKNARSSRDPQVQLRAKVLLRALTLENPAQACREFHFSPQLYQYWWRRFRESGFSREGLSTRSRRPKRSPKKTPPQVEAWIQTYRRKLSCSGEKIQLLLEKEKKVRVSLPTVYRVLARGGKKAAGQRRPKRKVVSAAGPSRPKPGRPAKTSSGQPHLQASLPREISDRYQVLRRLGSGGGGVVFLVEDKASGGVQRALKWVQTPRGSDPALAALLENEFAALAGWEHPHLARVYDLGLVPEGIYFTSEYIPGRDLLTAAGEADLNTLFLWIVQLLGALDSLHGRGILHLDLKPANILVSDSSGGAAPLVKLIDFGGAEWRRRGQAQAGETMGTPPYVAPELLLERAPGPAADLYALGMLLHQIFYQAFPLRHRDPLLMMQEQIYEDPLRFASLPPALPESFGELLHKLVARDPAQRFASAREVLTALNQSLGEDFSLRPPALPQGILAESSFSFHPEIQEKLVERFSFPQSGIVLLSGGPGCGKSRVIRRVKESLQLGRVFPVFVQEEAQFDAALQGAKRSKAPLLIDLDAEPTDLPGLLDRLDEANLPVLLATRRSYSPELIAQDWVECPPLTRQEVLAFFRAEVAGGPSENALAALADMGAGAPERLETLLQALQEAGSLQWYEGGWAWRQEAEPKFATLLQDYAQRWEARRLQTVETLGASPLGLDVGTLAGILGVEFAWLQPRLESWVGEGWLKRRSGGGILRYTLVEVAAETAASAPRDWAKLDAELERLYEQGNFEAGARWADALRAESAEVMPTVALHCARHYVANGEAEHALEMLPDPPPKGGQGLAEEIRARAELAMGDLAAARASLQRAEAEYDAAHDARGRSRVCNLRGSLEKRQQEFSAAVSAFDAAIQWAERADDAYLLGLAEMNLALLHQEQGDFRRAAEGLAEAEATAERAGHPWLRGRLLQNSLNLLFNMGRLAEAEARCYTLLRHSIQHRYVELQATAHNFLALVAGQRGQRDLQATQLNLALHLLRPRELWLPYTQTLLNRAFFNWEQGRSTAAELDAGYALDLAKRLQHPHFIAWAQLLMGRILRDRPRPDLPGAAACLNRAHQRIHQLNNRPLLWEVEFDRGLVLKKMGQAAQAQAFFRRALRALERLLAELPEFARQSYLRDRKLEKVQAELE